MCRMKVDSDVVYVERVWLYGEEGKVASSMAARTLSTVDQTI